MIVIGHLALPIELRRYKRKYYLTTVSSMGGDFPGFPGGHLYSQLQIASRLIDASNAETTLAVGGQLRAARLGLAMEHGMPLLARVAAVPIVISVHVQGEGRFLHHIRVATRVVRLGRTLMVTQSTFSGESGETIGFGTITWSVSGPLPGGGVADAPPSPTSGDQLPWPRLLDALGVQTLPEGDGCRLAAISPGIAAPGGVLHAGASQILCEQAALLVAGGTLSTDDVVTRDCVFHLLAAGRDGPFVARADLMGSGTGEAAVRVELRDEGRDGRLVALADVRLGLGQS